MHVTKQTIDWQAVNDKLRVAQAAWEQSSTVTSARMQQVFQERAARLATRATSRQAAADSTPVLAFRCGEETCGIELQYIAQVFAGVPITPVPGAPEWLLGIANLQGDVRSVLGLRRLFGLPDSGLQTHGYVLLVRHDGRMIGLEVEQLEGVRSVPRRTVTAMENAAEPSRRYIQAVTPDNLIVLRPEAICEHVSLRDTQPRTTGDGGHDSPGLAEHRHPPLVESSQNSNQPA